LNKASDEHFLHIAKWFRKDNITLQEYVSALDYIKKRCHRLGYNWTKGCCGYNTLEKITNE